VPAAAAVTGLLAGKKYVAMAEVEKRDSEESVWFAYKGQVFDGTPFLEDHPGGADSILMVGGKGQRVGVKS